MRRKVFHIDAYKLEDDPPEFDLADQTFHCLPELKAVATASLNFFTSSTQNCIAFISACLVPDDRSRFASLIDGDEVIITGAKLAEIVNWLTEVYTARPTVPPALSGSGRSLGSISSTASSPSGGSSTNGSH